MSDDKGVDMPDCNYCDESFADEDAYLEHLYSAHDKGELSRIDRRRVEKQVGYDDEGLPTGPIIIAGLILFTAAILAYVTFFVWGGYTEAPGVTSHYGTINMTVNGDRINFSKAKYHDDSERFTFDNGHGRIWHEHKTNMTLQTAMRTLGVTVTDSKVLLPDGTSYADSDAGTNVTVLVNGQEVNPTTYVLDGVENADNAAQGDTIKIVVTSNQTG